MYIKTLITSTLTKNDWKENLLNNVTSLVRKIILGLLQCTIARGERAKLLCTGIIKVVRSRVGGFGTETNHDTNLT